jgi:cytochrome c-type biogenesis protein CcsB
MDLQGQLTLAIDTKTVQAALANLSFLTLLGTLIFYWIQTSFSDFLSPFPFLTPVGGLEQGGRAGEVGMRVPKPFNLINLTVGTGMIASNILLGLLLLLRWKESGHFPLSNLYESLMFLSWCFTFIHLVIENYTFSSSLSPTLFQSPNGFPNFSKVGLKSINRKNKIPNLLGAITTPSALFTNAFATFTLPKEMQEAAPLVPALQSNWLMMHVTVMILSYAALIIGSLLSIAFLVVTLNTPSSSLQAEGSVTASTDSSYSQPGAPTRPQSSIGEVGGYSAPFPTSGWERGRGLAFILDNLSYRILGIGFPFLTIGILSGAVWANEAWGSYWSWDPKETWALLTWLIFAIYLHTRISKGWEGKKPAIIASFGFVVVWICYLGVNLIGEGLHSYGWFS